MKKNLFESLRGTLLSVALGAAIVIAATAGAAMTGAGGGSLPAGAVIAYAGGTVPAGFIDCANGGTAISRTGANAALFAAVGTTWGAGDLSTTFNPPNLQRRVLVGAGGTGTATLANTLGSTGGEEVHTPTLAEMFAHNHPVTVTLQSTDGAGVGGGPDQFATTAHTTVTNGGGFLAIGPSGISGSSSNTGSSTAFNVRDPAAVVRFLCKL